MKTNMSVSDSIIRIIISAIILGLSALRILNGIPGIILLILALFFNLTSLFSFCPIYKLLGIRTNMREKTKDIDIQR